MFDGMDEDEIVARIMQQVRECESSSRRNLRRPKNGISYRLDKNGSIVPSASGEEPASSYSVDPEAQQQLQQQPQPPRSRQLYSVDDCRKPVPSYQVEVNTDRVGSFYRNEMDDAFQYLMSGTPRRNPTNKKTIMMRQHGQVHPTHEDHGTHANGTGTAAASSRRGRASRVVAPRYLSVGRGKDDSDESFVEQYDLVQYEEESVAPRAASAAASAASHPAKKAAVGGVSAATVPLTPRRSVVRDVRAADPSPGPAKAKSKDRAPDARGTEDAAAAAAAAVTLNQSTSTHSSSSSSSSTAATPVPSSPNQVPWKVEMEKARTHMASGASVVTVTPTDAPASALCAMGWMRGGDGNGNGNFDLFRANYPSCAPSVPRNDKPTDFESPPTAGASATTPAAAAAPPATLYERLALPLCRATSAVETEEIYRQWHSPQELAREASYGTSDVESMMRRTTTITTVATTQPPLASSSSTPNEHQEEEDVDILRPWGFSSILGIHKAAATGTACAPLPPRARSTKSATSSVLRTIRETTGGSSSDRDSTVDEPRSDYYDEDEDDDASSIVTRDDLRRRQSTIQKRHGSMDPSRHRRRSRTDASSCAGTTVTGTTNASRSTAVRSRRGDDDGSVSVSVSECTTLYDPSASHQRNYLRYPPGCMALVQNVWQGIDRAERALLGSMSVDDDLWTDLYEDEYDLYSTERTVDRSEGEDASLSTATSSHWMTAERSGLTTLSGDDRSHIVSTRRAGSRVAMEDRTAAKRSPRRSQYLSSRS
jgi:hypothetical protein